MGIKDTIKDAQDLREKLVPVTEWGVEILMRTMTAGMRAKMLDTCLDSDGTFIKSKSTPFFIVACAHDPETKARIFDENDIPMLLEKRADIVEKLALEGMRLSGFGREEEEAIEKNSDSGIPSASSISN